MDQEAEEGKVWCSAGFLIFTFYSIQDQDGTTALQVDLLPGHLLWININLCLIDVTDITLIGLEIKTNHCNKNLYGKKNSKF